MKKVSVLLCFLLFLPFFVCGYETGGQGQNEYKISATFCEEDKTLSCKQTSTYVNRTENALDFLEMFLYANSFAKTWQNASISKCIFCRHYRVFFKGNRQRFKWIF